MSLCCWWSCVRCFQGQIPALALRGYVFCGLWGGKCLGQFLTVFIVGITGPCDAVADE